MNDIATLAMEPTPATFAARVAVPDPADGANIAGIEGAVFVLNVGHGLVASFDDDVTAFLLVPPRPAEFALFDFPSDAKQIAGSTNRAVACGSVSEGFYHRYSPPPRILSDPIQSTKL